MSVSAAHESAFYAEAAEHQRVWGIRDDDGFPAPLNGDGERATPFWSLRSRADRVVSTVSAYAAFEVVEVPLDAFLTRWLPGLERDGPSGRAQLVGLSGHGIRHGSVTRSSSPADGLTLPSRGITPRTGCGMSGSRALR